jgi:predicted GTPase
MSSELIAGEGGSVLVAAATSTHATALACEGLAAATETPSGTPVYPADRLPPDLGVGRVRVLACEPSTRETVGSWASQRGIEVIEDEPPVVYAPPGVRIAAVSAVSTASGKTALVRRVARTLLRSGVGVAVARHPIADLLAWDRFDPVIVGGPSELAGPRPIAEREELAPVVGAGVPVIVGLDAERVLEVAARQAGDGGVVVWDGGGAAAPWVEPDLHLVAVDLLRPPPKTLWSRLATADAVVLTKADSAPAAHARTLEEEIRTRSPEATVVLADLAVGVQPGNALIDRRVVIVEDATSLTLGGLAAGAGAVAARRFRCGVVDPRPFAVGAISSVLATHAHIGAVIPSLGRTLQELDDLAASVSATPGDAVLWASNADPAMVIADEPRPVIRAYGELTEVAGSSLQQVLGPLLPGHG